MLYYYLLFVSGFALLSFLSGALGVAGDIGDLVTRELWWNHLYRNVGVALVAGSIWWLHWRSLAKLWPNQDKGDQVFAKIYLWGTSLLLMLITMITGSGLAAGLLRLLAGDLGINQSVAGTVVARIGQLLVVLPLWRLHWRQIELHSASDDNLIEAKEQPA